MDTGLASNVVDRVPDRLKGLFDTPAEYVFLHYAVSNSLRKKDGGEIAKSEVLFPAEINYQSFFSKLRFGSPDKEKRLTELERITRKFIKINDLDISGIDVFLIESIERRKNQRTMVYETLIGHEKLIIGCVGYSSKDVEGLFDGMPNIEWAVSNPVSVSGHNLGSFSKERMMKFVRYWLREHD